MIMIMVLVVMISVITEASAVTEASVAVVVVVVVVVVVIPVTRAEEQAHEACDEEQWYEPIGPGARSAGWLRLMCTRGASEVHVCVRLV